MANITIDNLTFRYKGEQKPALNRVDLRIDEGEFVLVSGPSGCGKTTLVRTLNGLIPHFYEGDMNGRVIVKGLDTRTHGVAELSRLVGVVFQNPDSQFITLNVEREIAFGLENLGEDPNEIKERVEDIIKSFNLEDIRDKPPYMLSGGEKQKVIIAAVLAMGTEILVLDEPTASLDPASSRQIIDLIHRVNVEKNVTVILTEHRTEYAARYADRVVIMDSGRVVANGDPRSVFLIEKTEKCGVFIPKTVSLYEFLAKRGFTLPKVPLSPEEVTSLIRGERGVREPR